MKTKTIAPLRADPELPHAAEDALPENESLSACMEEALGEGGASPRLQREFIARGLDSREQARRDNEYFDADNVIAELERMLSTVRKAE